VDDVLEQHIGGSLHGIVEAVAVGGLEQDIVGLGEDFGTPEDHVLIAADIAAEGEMGLLPVLLYLQTDGGAADDVASIGVENADIFIDGEPVSIFDGNETIESAFGVIFGVKGLEIGFAFGFPFLIDVFYFVFLDPGAVFEENGREFAGRGGTIDLPREAIPDELGDEPAMIDMGVRQDEYAYLGRIEAPVTVKHICLTAEALEHPAVEQIFLAIIKREEVLGAGDGTGSAVESDFHVDCLSG
jgi:hypothetical protein